MQRKFRIRSSFPCSDNRKSAIQKRPRRRTLVGPSIIAFMLVVAGAAAEAQQSGKIPRIGFLTAVAAASSGPEAFRQRPGPGAFRQGLHELGYVEGKNIVIEWRSAEGKLDRISALAAELVRLKVDVIVTGGSTNTRAAKEATTAIPIVMLQDPDPVGNRFVASLARPGGNITGLSSLTADLSGKRLELLKEIIPKLSRAAVLGTSTNQGNARQLRETERTAGALGVQLQFLDILGPKDIEIAFRAAGKWRAEAVHVLRGPVLNRQQTTIVELAAENRLPATYPQGEYVEDGGLMSYGVSDIELGRRAAIYVDKILKGAKPAELPVEQATKFELVINLKTAKTLGLKIPPHLLMEADRVVE